MKTLLKKLRSWRDKKELQFLNWVTSEKPIETDWECEPRDNAGRLTSFEPQRELRQEYLKHQQ